MPDAISRRAFAGLLGTAAGATLIDPRLHGVTPSEIVPVKAPA
jgi:hypothetical protein